MYVIDLNFAEFFELFLKRTEFCCFGLNSFDFKFIEIEL